MVLAAHRIDVEVRRFFTGERDVTRGSFAGVLAKQTADFQHHGDRRRVVVSAGS